MQETLRQIPNPDNQDKKPLLDELNSKDTRTKILHFIKNMGVLEATAEDITQETMIRANQAIDRFDGRAKLTTWLYTIARNLAINNFRKEKTRKEDPEESEVPDFSLHPESILDPHVDLRIAIEKLEPNYREVLELRNQEKSYAEIAEILDIPLGTVMTRIYRAKKELEQFLKRKNTLK